MRPHPELDQQEPHEGTCCRDAKYNGRHNGEEASGHKSIELPREQAGPPPRSGREGTSLRWSAMARRRMLRRSVGGMKQAGVDARRREPDGICCQPTFRCRSTGQAAVSARQWPGPREPAAAKRRRLRRPTQAICTITAARLAIANETIERSPQGPRR
jgi:hypothetical protein